MSLSGSGGGGTIQYDRHHVPKDIKFRDANTIGLRAWREIFVKVLSSMWFINGHNEKTLALKYVCIEYVYRKSAFEVKEFTRTSDLNFAIKTEPEATKAASDPEDHGSYKSPASSSSSKHKHTAATIQPATPGFGTYKEPLEAEEDKTRTAEQILADMLTGTRLSKEGLTMPDRHGQEARHHAMRVLTATMGRAAGEWYNPETGANESPSSRGLRLKIYDAAADSLKSVLPQVSELDRGDLRMLWQLACDSTVQNDRQIEIALNKKIHSCKKTQSITFSEWSAAMREHYQELGLIGREPDSRSKISDLLSALDGDVRYKKIQREISTHASDSYAFLLSLVSQEARHLKDLVPTGKKKKPQHETHYTADGDDSRPSQRSSKICIAHAKGQKCRYGDKCKFCHVELEELK